jgi:hypothetical protein
MPMLRPLAALLAACTVAACAAGSHRVPDEDDRIDVAHRDSLVAGSAIPATMPFEGSVYPVPASHQAAAVRQQRPHEAAGPGHTAPDAENGTRPDDAAPQQPQPQLQAQPTQPVTPVPAAPVPPSTDDDDEHAGHDP